MVRVGIAAIGLLALAASVGGCAAEVKQPEPARHVFVSDVAKQGEQELLRFFGEAGVRVGSNRSRLLEFFRFGQGASEQQVAAWSKVLIEIVFKRCERRAYAEVLDAIGPSPLQDLVITQHVRQRTGRLLHWSTRLRQVYDRIEWDEGREFEPDVAGEVLLRLPWVRENVAKFAPENWIVVGFNHPSNYAGAGFLFPARQYSPTTPNDDVRELTFFGSSQQLMGLCKRLRIEPARLSSLRVDHPLIVQNSAFCPYALTDAEAPFADDMETTSEIRVATPRQHDGLNVFSLAIDGLPEAGMIVPGKFGPTDPRPIARFMFFRDFNEAEEILRSVTPRYNRPVTIVTTLSPESERFYGVLRPFAKDRVFPGSMSELTRR